MTEELAAPARVVFERLALRPGERALVLANPGFERIVAALAESARAAGAAVRTLAFPSGARHGQEPPHRVAAAMRVADVVVAPTAYSLTHTAACRRAKQLGARIVTMPGVTEETFLRAIAVDYTALEQRSRMLASRLTEATHARLLTSNGTELELLLEGRPGLANDGDVRAAGASGNLPAGEGYIAPVERRSRGHVVLDGSLAGWGPLAEPLSVAVEAGSIVAADGEAARWLLRELDRGGPRGRTLCELGIGTNPCARLCGSTLEDEKALGTVHVAFGTNVGFGGANVADVHLDGVVRAPTLELDGELVIEHGRLTTDPGL